MFMTKFSLYSIIIMKMKKYNLPVWIIGSLMILLNACATRVQPRETVPEIPVIQTPKETLSAIEQIRLRVKQNGSDVVKSFDLDDDGQITVKANFRYGISRYEVIYDLENLAGPVDSAYTINFTISEKPYGLYTEDSLLWIPEDGTEGILLSLDDDYMQAWEQYFDLFEKYNCRITFFIQGAWEPDIIGPFAAEAIRRGHDIGFHSINHLDLRSISMETFLAETAEPAEIYRSRGIPLSAFAYPFGFSEPWMHEILLGSFDVLRGYGVTFRLYNEENIRTGYLISKAIDNTVIQGNENFEKTVLSMLRTVKFLNDRRILPVTTHDISDEAAWGITAERLEYFLKSASELNLKFYLYSDFAKK